MTEAANIPITPEDVDVEEFAQHMESGRLFEAARRIRLLGERIGKAEAECKALRSDYDAEKNWRVQLAIENKTLRGQVERLKAPVSDEEFMEATGSTEVYDDELLTREAVSALIASRAEEKHG